MKVTTRDMERVIKNWMIKKKVILKYVIQTIESCIMFVIFCTIRVGAQSYKVSHAARLLTEMFWLIIEMNV